MGSDLARVSYDPRRHWRGVVSQQGRVTVEADFNEASTIAAEGNRAQLVDVVGPSGTADGGYAVTPVTDSTGAATGDLTIAHGTLYVGGERMVLESDITYSQQSDWIDFAGDPLGPQTSSGGDGPQPPGPTNDGNEIVYLMLREQEVGAVEDPALLDVALGGPDTSERRRIIQRVVRKGVQAASTNCAAALADLEQAWGSELGLGFDAQTMLLKPSATLQVSFQAPVTAPTPCEPAAQGGFLGADNQLIRVQIASVDAGVPTLVWGFDNAHFLYRIAPNPVVNTGAGTTTLTLTNTPVDSFHQPVAGQAVEVLKAAALIDGSDYIAAANGTVTTLVSDYQPSTQQVVVATDVDGGGTAGPPLFLRVWQGTVQGQEGPVALGNTGIEVTISAGSGTYHVGDYWVFAVRPGAPSNGSQIYPQRIFDSPQPPHGPRLWACPLALIEWNHGSPTVLDCRKPFENLVDALAALTATHISFDPGTCEVLQGSHTVADALDLLCEHAEQGEDFSLALLRLFGRGVICGLVPSITVAPPAQGSTDVPIEITVSDGTMIDGRGGVVTLSNVAPLDLTLPAVDASGAGVEVKQWLYLVTAPGQSPQLELQPNPPAGRLTLSQDVVAAFDNPASGPVIPDSATCSDAESDAWQVFNDVSCVVTNGDAGVCLGIVGVQGPAGWTSPDDREQIFPTPAMTCARWLMQRQPTYDLIKAACVAGAVTVQSIVLGGANGPNLEGQGLLGGTTGRQATVILDDVVRGTAPLAITLESSGGVTVHGPVAIAPGQSSASFTFDIADVAGAQTITAVIDAQRQLQVPFTAVSFVGLQLPSGQSGVMAGDPLNVGVVLSAPASEPVSFTLSGANLSTAVIVLPVGATSQMGQVTAATSGQMQVSAVSQVSSNQATGSGPTRTLQFTAIGLSTMVNANGANIDGTILVQGNSIPGATVRLTGAAPYPVNISISIAAQAQGGLPALTPSPNAVTISPGQTASSSFTLAADTGRVGAMNVQGAYHALQVTARVTVTKSKEKEVVKDNKDRKDVTPDKVTIEKITAAEKVQNIEVLPKVTEEVAGNPEPVGQAFVTSSQRPAVGVAAFGATASGGQP